MIFTTPRLLALPLAAAAFVVATAAPAQAAPRTIEVIMNGHRHEVKVPDGWQSHVEDGGATFNPPSGRYPGVQVVMVGVAKAKDAVTPIQMAKNIADSEKKKKPYLSSTEAEPMRFMGAEGAIITLDGTTGGRRETSVYVVSMFGDTTYLLQASGSFDNLMAAVNEVKVIIDSARVTGDVAPKRQDPPPPPQDPPPKAAPPQRHWSEDAALPPPAAGKKLIDDPLLGVAVARVDGWGLGMDREAYLLEKRLDKKQRVIVGVQNGKEKFTGSGRAYMEKVAGGDRARFDRFGGQDAVLVWRAQEKGSDADYLEVHVLRGETPLLITARTDGMKWTDRRSRELLAELDGGMTVSAQGKAKGKIVIGGVLTINLGGWKVDSYGPGPWAKLSKGSKKATVYVATKAWGMSLECDNGNKEPTEEPVSVNGKPARRLSCPKDQRDPLVYDVDAGVWRLVFGFGDDSGTNHAGVAEEFLKMVKF